MMAMGVEETGQLPHLPIGVEQRLVYNLFMYHKAEVC